MYVTLHTVSFLLQPWGPTVVNHRCVLYDSFGQVLEAMAETLGAQLDGSAWSKGSDQSTSTKRRNAPVLHDAIKSKNLDVLRQAIATGENLDEVDTVPNPPPLPCCCLLMLVNDCGGCLVHALTNWFTPPHGRPGARRCCWPWRASLKMLSSC